MISLLFSGAVAFAQPADKSCGPLLEIAIASAKDAAVLTQEALRRGDFSREQKPDGSLVTAADLAVSNMLVEKLARETGLPVFSEENPPPSVEELMSWERFWLIDPIDGTENFARAGTDFSVLIALMERPAPNAPARPIVGVIGRPSENKIYFGAIQGGSWKLDFGPAAPTLTRLFARAPAARPLVTAQKKTEAILQERSMVTDFDFTRVGGNGAKFIALASGTIDCYLAQPMKWWDVGAGDALYRYAVADGDAPRPSPLVYQPHPQLAQFYQERGFMIGGACLAADARDEVLKVLNRRLDNRYPPESK